MSKLEKALESDVDVKAKKAKRAVTPEEVEGMKEAVAFVSQAGFVSEKAAKLLSLVPLWHDTEANKAVKEEVIEFFGGIDTFKDYVDSEFEAELLKLRGLGSLGTVGNTIKHFYARRKSTGASKATVQVNIGGTVYSVNKAYLAEIADKSNDEKKELLLAHPQTKVSEVVQAL